MRLYAPRIPQISEELIHALSSAGDIEVGEEAEAKLDVEAVLKEYLRMDREITEKAKDILESRGMDYGKFARVKKGIAEERDFGLGEEAIGWICSQLLETFMHSNHIEEVFSDDATLRRKMKDVLVKHMQVDDDLDQEVRQRIKNLQEGTATWEIEYSKVMDQIKRKHGLE